MKRNALLKVVVAIVAVGALGVLFVRSAQSTRAEPYEIARDRFTRWTLAVGEEPGRSGIVLGLRPQEEAARDLFNQVFMRSGESMRGPSPAEIPLVLARELDAIRAGTRTPQMLLEMARQAGLETPTFASQCMAYRRVSQPGSTRQVYFARFDWPAFDAFRRQVAEGLPAGSSSFQPAALSPVLVIAASDDVFASWLPLGKGAADDCVAPIAVH